MSVNSGVHVVGVLRTIVIFLVSVVLALYVFTEISWGWGGFLFLVLGVFVGIPLMGAEEPTRPWRFALFLLAMLFFMAYSAVGARYKLFSTPVHVVGTRCAERDFTRNLKWYDGRIYGWRVTDVRYGCISADDETYFVALEGSENLPQALGVDGFFISGHETERDTVLEEAILQEGESQESMHFGFFRRERRDAFAAVDDQYGLMLMLTSLFAVLFVLEEVHFSRKVRKKPEASKATLSTKGAMAGRGLEGKTSRRSKTSTRSR